MINDGRKRQNANRRAGKRNQRRNQHLLEVKVRSRRAAELKYSRMVAWLARCVIAVTILIAAVWGGREAMRRFLWENRDFLIRELDVRTDGSLPRSEIMALAGALEGINIFSVNLSDAHRRLSECPQVEQVEIRRELPDRLTIRIRERKPVAWLANSLNGEAPSTANAFLLDSGGNLMRPSVLGGSVHTLPVIYGFAIGDLRPGSRVEAERVRLALELLRLNAGNTRFDITAVDVSSDYCIEVIDRRRMRATFGPDEIDMQLSRLNRVLDHVEASRRDLATINLMVERNIPVTFVPLEDRAAALSGSDDPPRDGTLSPAVAPAKPAADKPKSSGKKAESNAKPKPKSTPKPALKKTAEEKPVRRAEPVMRAQPASTPPPPERPAKRGFSIPNPFTKRHG